MTDRGLSWPALVDQCRRVGWSFLLRVQGQTRVRTPDGRTRAIRDLAPHPGTRWQGHGYAFKDAGWRDVNVVAVWRRGTDQPWLLVTDLAPTCTAALTTATAWTRRKASAMTSPAASTGTPAASVTQPTWIASSSSSNSPPASSSPRAPSSSSTASEPSSNATTVAPSASSPSASAGSIVLAHTSSPSSLISSSPSLDLAKCRVLRVRGWGLPHSGSGGRGVGPTSLGLRGLGV